MTSGRLEAGPARSGGLLADLRALAAEQRLAAIAAVLLLATMFLPWYTKDTTAAVNGQPVTVSQNKLAITVFSWVEAAIFLVAVGVTVLIVARGRGRAFHLPGGDGLVVTAAGAWATFLVFFRFVDKPSGQTGRGVLTDYGLSWGIFFGLLAALFLAYTGLRLRQARVAEPHLAGADPDPDRIPGRPGTPPTAIRPRRPSARRPGARGARSGPRERRPAPPRPAPHPPPGRRSAGRPPGRTSARVPSRRTSARAPRARARARPRTPRTRSSTAASRRRRVAPSRARSTRRRIRTSRAEARAGPRGRYPRGRTGSGRSRGSTSPPSHAA
jgi:hypothetical protein